MSVSKLRVAQPEGPLFDGSGLLMGWGGGIVSNPIGFRHADNSQARPECPIQLTGEGHVLTIAPTGAGKGVSCVIPALLTYEGPTIVIDPKGENASVTADRRRELGHQVHVIDPFGITNIPPSRFNPMDVVDPRYADMTDDAAMLASMLVPDYGKDPFWSNRAKQLVLGLILSQCMEQPKGQRSLVAVRQILHELAANPRLASRFRLSANEDVRTVANMFASSPSNTIQSILSVASDALDLLRGEQLLNSLHASSFDLADITTGSPLTIYLVLPPHLMHSHGTILRLWIGALFAAITRRRGRPDLPTLLLIDEAAQLGTFEPLLNAITLMRGYGLRTWSFWQDPSQFQKLYKDWPTLISNCRAIQVFGKLGVASACRTAEVIGLNGPDMLLALGEDEMVLAEAGVAPRIVRRPNYLSDLELQGLARSNPLHEKSVGQVNFRRRRRVHLESVDRAEQMELFPEESLSPEGMKAFLAWRKRGDAQQG